MAFCGMRAVHPKPRSCRRSAETSGPARVPDHEGVPMRAVDRRRFLQLAGGAAGLALLPTSIARAAAIPADRRSGTLEDVEHIVVLMQENRSFDHYFGTMRGVRGFGDPHPVRLPSGKSVWHQSDGSAEVLPFRPDMADLGLVFL